MCKESWAGRSIFKYSAQQYLLLNICVFTSELYASALMLTIPTKNPQSNFVPKNKLIFKLVSLNHFYYYSSQKPDIKKQLWNWNKRYQVGAVQQRDMQGLGSAEEKLTWTAGTRKAGWSNERWCVLVPYRDLVVDSLDSTHQCLHFPSKLGGNQAEQTKKQLQMESQMTATDQTCWRTMLLELYPQTLHPLTSLRQENDLPLIKHEKTFYTHIR